MTKLVLDVLNSGSSLSVINDNFQKIQTELQNNILYRNNPIGEPNSLGNDIDMNGKRIYNLPAPISNSEAARLQDIVDATSGILSASLIPFTPYGAVSSVNVQGAIQELDSEKVSKQELSLSSGSSLIGGGVQIVNSIALLRSLLKTSASKTAITTGYYTNGDGGGGAYYYDATDVISTDNGGTVIVATDGGRWKLIHEGTVNVKQFGAKGDNTFDDTGAIQKCIVAMISRGGGTLLFPDGTYLLTSVQNIGMTPRAIQDPNLFVSNASNLKFIGTGNSILTTGLPATMTEILFFYKCTNIEVSGLQFKGNNAGLLPANNNCALGAVSVVGLNLHDCQFYGFQGSYLGCSWLFNSNIERNIFTVSGGSAIDVAFLQNVVIRDNRMTGSGLGSNGLGTTGIQVLYDIPNAAYNETGITFVNGYSNNITIETNSISGFGSGLNLSDLVDTKVLKNNIFNNYISADSQSWGIVIGNTRSGFTMDGISISDNFIYANGSTVSGGGVTIGAGTALGVVVDFSGNEIYDNSHIGLNIGSVNISMRGVRNRFYNRFNANQTTKTAGFSNLTNKSFFINNDGFNPASPTLPSVPAGLGLANAVTNLNPYPVTIYQASGTGLHIVTPSGVDIAVSGGGQTTFRLMPYHKAYFSGVNTVQWNWVFE